MEWECACAFCNEAVQRAGAVCVFCSVVCKRAWPGDRDLALWSLHRMKGAAELEGTVPAVLAVDAAMNGTLDHVARLMLEERENRALFKECCCDESE